MKFTLAPAIILLSVGSVNKNFHYVPRGGALVQITPKFSSSILLLLFSPYYNNIIPQQQELVKVNYIIAGIIGNSPELVRFLQMLRHWNPVSLTLRPQIAYSHWLKMRPQQ